jgi:hypothetical protein
MSKGEHDILALVINYLGADWQPKQITLHLFKATNTSGQTLAKKLAKLLVIYGLRRIIVAYVKDEGFNLNIITTILKSIVNFECVGFGRKFLRNLFIHFLKRCQYVTTHEKVCKSLIYVSMKVAQGDLQKCITCPKNREKLGKSGRKHVLIQVFPQGNSIF